MTADHVYAAILAAVLVAGAILVWLEPPSPGNASGRGPGGESPQ